MSKIEILAPVGSEEMLRAAVFSGADAVYLRFSGFNARTGAQRTLGSQQGRTSVICAACHSQHGAKAALVAVARARRDVVPDKFGCDLG